MISDADSYRQAARGRFYMQANGTNLFQSPDHTPAFGNADPAWKDDQLAGCVSKAEDLLRTLREEAEALKRFENRRLMTLLPRKELLVRELLSKVTALKAQSAQENRSDTDPKTRHLKERLVEIEKLNQENRVLIEGSLAHFKDFLDCIYPSNYGPTHEGFGKQKSMAFRGLTFRKEA